MNKDYLNKMQENYLNKMKPRKYKSKFKSKMLRINCECGLAGYKQGEIFPVKVADDGLPLESYWRRRLEEAKIDNCVEFVYFDSETKKYEPLKDKEEIVKNVANS